jgi:serine/threonine protein phosphatase PrpC
VNCGEQLSPEFAFCEACGCPTREHGAPGLAGVIPAPRCLCGSESFDGDGYCESCGRKPAAADSPDVQVLDEIAACASHRGRHHDDNQDSAGLLRLPNGRVAIAVADGVSTACHSRRAADTAVQQAFEVFADCSDAEPGKVLKLAVKRAHAAICRLPHDDSVLAEPQTTVALALVQEDTVWYAWVGDSRVYLLHSEGSRLLSTDDSWLNERLSEGVPVAAAMADDNAHCITQCLGMRDDEPVIHVAREQILQGSWLLLCSDGLWNYVGEAGDLWSQVSGCAPSTPLSQRCTELIERANRAGGADNITVALYRHQSMAGV